MSCVPVRGCRIGEGRPKVILPIVERTEAAILEKAAAFSTLCADCVEWRVDLFEAAADPGAVVHCLAKLRVLLKEKLLPLAAVVTPNIPEAEVLADMEIQNEGDMEEAAKKISEKYHCAVLCKGGHNINDANDLLFANGEARWFLGKRIHNPNTHGTGCTLSSAIASNLAKGFPLEEAVQRAKDYISGALNAMLDLGITLLI